MCVVAEAGLCPPAMVLTMPAAGVPPSVTDTVPSCESHPLCHVHERALTHCHPLQFHRAPQVAAASRPSLGLTGRAPRLGSSTAIQTWPRPSASSARRVPRKVCQQSLGSVLVLSPCLQVPRQSQAQVGTVRPPPCGMLQLFVVHVSKQCSLLQPSCAAFGYKPVGLHTGLSCLSSAAGVGE